MEEGITNIVKQAGANRVGVILKTSPHDVVMIIEDDGSGFELETLNRGGLEIETRPGEGTTLIVRVPLDDSAAGC